MIGDLLPDDSVELPDEDRFAGFVFENRGAARLEAIIALASSATSLPRVAASRSSSKRSRSLFDAAPSVPIPTVTPASSSSWIGAIPLASFVFDAGQWTTPVPRSASKSISPSSRCTP